MLYEWDEQKRAANKARHRVDFLVVVDFDWDSALVAPDDRRDYGEERFVSIGPIKGRLHVLIFTRRDATVRIISLRKANKREVRQYEKAQTNQ